MRTSRSSTPSRRHNASAHGFSDKNESGPASTRNPSTRSLAMLPPSRSRASISVRSSGSPREPWLEPDVCEVIKALAKDGARHVVVSPAGFVCDHVEVLYDLDVEAKWIAAEHGVTLHRASAVNAHPEFIAMLADLVQQAQGRTEPTRA